jgi:hypothetical protein
MSYDDRLCIPAKRILHYNKRITIGNLQITIEALSYQLVAIGLLCSKKIAIPVIEFHLYP